MKRDIHRIFGLAAAAILAAGGVTAGQAASQYFLLREIPIGGVAGTPSLTVDAEGRRLYVTHSSKIDVVDLDKEESVGSISNASSVRGFAAAPKFNRGFFSNSRDGSVSVIDLKTLATTTKVKAADGTGPMLYEPVQQQVYAFNTRVASATVLDAASAKIAATVALPGKVWAAADDPGAGRIYCGIIAGNQVVALDAKTHKVAGVWPAAPGKEPAGIAADAASHRVYVGCRNKTMVVMDGLTGKVTATVPVGTGVDGTVYDPSSQLVFCAGSDTTTTIAHQDSPAALSVVQTLRTERNARIIALDPATRKIYLATTDYEAQSEPDPGTPATRAHTLANSLKILVYGPGPP